MTAMTTSNSMSVKALAKGVAKGVTKGRTFLRHELVCIFFTLIAKLPLSLDSLRPDGGL